MRKEFTSNQRRSIVARYKRGESSISIGADYGCSSNVILRLLRAEGVRVKKPGRYATAAA